MATSDHAPAAPPDRSVPDRGVSDRAGRYRQLRAQRPDLFANPDGACFEILSDPDQVAAAEKAAAERLHAAGQPESWALTGVVYEDQYVVFVRDAVRFPDGHLGTYVREVSPDEAPGVVILPVLDGHIVLVHHFRHATRTWHWELPRGFAAPGLTGEQNARQELREELGAEPTTLVPLGPIHPDTGMTADPVHLFYAEIPALGPLATDEGITGAHPVTPADLAHLISTAEITDAYTITTYTRATLRGLLPSSTL